MGRPVVALLGVLAAGCVSASVHRLDQDLRPPCAPEMIEVLEEAPDCPYTVIARIESKSDAVFHGYDDLRRKLVEEAAELGGEALILGGEDSDHYPIILTTGMIMSEEKTLEAEVIVFDPVEDTGSSGAAGG
jgi:hypothetical protein